MSPFTPNSTAMQTQTAENIQAWFTAQIAEQLSVDPTYIDPNLSFDNFGLNSVQAMSIAQKTEQFLGVSLSPVLLWHYPTIASLSERLAEEAADTEFTEI